MKLTRSLIAFAAATLLTTGCSTNSARYAASADNNALLKAFTGTKVKVANIGQAGNFDSNCRLLGPIKPADGLTLPQFIEKAFNEEFKFAGLYADNGLALSGQLNKAEFSSISGMTKGWWELGITLNSPNGRKLNLSNHYDFESGFDAFTACSQTAQALGPAVQNLIKQAVTNPEFALLLK